MGNIYRFSEFYAAHQYNKENNPISNQIYDTLAEFQNQNKQIILCKVPIHIGIKGNEEVNKRAKRQQI